MAQFSFIAGLALATLAAAGPHLAPPPVAINAQIGRLHLPITCTILNSLEQTFEVVTSGGSPAYAANGAEFYVTDVAGLINIPENVVQLSRNAGATHATANLTIYINATNASPQQLPAFSGVVPVNFPANGSSSIRFPNGNGTGLTGPFTVGSGSEPALTLVGNVEVHLNLLNDKEESVLEVPVVCGRQNIDYVLAAVSVDNTATTGSAYDPKPSNGYIPDFGVVPLSTEYGFFRFPYNCVFGPLGTQAVDLTVGGQIPTFFNPGELFTLERATAFLRAPGNLIKEAHIGFPKTKNIRVNVTEFDLLFSNTVEGSINVAAKRPLVSLIDITNENGTEPLLIPIPEYTPLEVGPITVGSKVGDFVVLSVGNSTATTQLLDDQGNVLYEFPVQCSPFNYLELISVGISDQVPSNYSLGKNLNA